MSRFSKKWSVCYTVMLLSFSVYAILDTFVISSSYATEVQAIDSTSTSGSEQTAVSLATENDAETSVSMETYRAYDTDIYVATVTLSDITSLRSAFAEGTYGKILLRKLLKLQKG